MATGRDVTARVRITIDGVEASKKNLQALEEASQSLGEKLGALKKTQVELTNEFRTTGSADTGKKLAEVVKQVNELSTALKANKQVIENLRSNIDGYENVLDNLSGATLQKLNKASRDLAAQMKAQVTADDIEKWHALAQAQKEVQEQIQQLNGKAPNLTYVLQNLGSVSNKTLQDSRRFLAELLADTEQGTERMARLRQQLDQVNAEAQTRLRTQAEQAMTAVSPAGITGGVTTSQAREQIATLQSYRDTLNLQTQVDEIQRVEQAINAYEQALGKMQQKTIDVGRVLDDPSNFSTEEIRKAIAELEKQLAQTTVSDTGTISQLQQNITSLKTALASTAAEQENTFIEKIVRQAAEGKAGIADMEKAVKLLQDKLQRTPKSETGTIENLRQQLDTINPKLADTRVTLANVNKVLANIRSESISNLREAAQALNEQLKHAKGNTTEFADTAKKLKAVNRQIEELTEQASSASSQFEKAISRLKNWVLVYQGFDKTIDLIQDSIQGSIGLTDAMTDVQKVSGMTADEVKQLTDQIWKLDTRVQNSTLLESAVTGGKLGLKGIEEVFEYTKASSVALTALDELNSESIQTVMKVNDLLGETSRLGIEQAILSTSSAVNELSINTAASQMPIIDFTRRFGGIASQAHLATADVLALGATADALGQPIEVASTALNKFTTALVTNTKEIAADVGISREYAQELVNQGRTMDFMFDVLSRLGQMGGLQNIAQYMGDMGSEGSRMVSVIAALSSNVQALRDNVELSNESFEEGTSVLNEYNLKNENAQALVERMMNDLNEIAVNSSVATFIGYIVRALQLLVHWCKEGSAGAKLFMIGLTLVVTWVAKTTISLTKLWRSLVLLGSELKRQATATAIFGHSVDMLWKRFLVLQRQSHFTNIALASLSVGFKNLGKAIKALWTSNPIGWAFILVPMLWKFVASLFSATEGQKKYTESIDQTNAKIEDELYELNKLIDKNTELERATLSENEAKRQRIELIGQMNRNYSQYIGFLLNESASYREIATAADIATAAIKRKNYEEGRAQAETDINKKYQNQILQGSRDLKNMVNQMAQQFSLTENQAKDLFKAIQADFRKSIAEVGKAQLGANVREVLGRIGIRNVKTIRRSFRGGSFTSSIGKEEEIIPLDIKHIIAQINSLDEIKSYIATLIKRQQETSDTVEAYNLSIYEAETEQLEGLGRMKEIYSHKLKDFDPKKATSDDMLFITSQIKINRQMAELYGQGSQQYDALMEEVKEYDAKQVEVLKAQIDAPIMERNYTKDKYGNIVWGEGFHTVKKMSEAMPQTMAKEITYWTTTFKNLVERSDFTTNEIVQKYAKKAGDKVKRLEDALHEQGWKLNSKGELELDLSRRRERSGSRGTRSAATDSYQAMLNTVNAYFDRLDSTIKERYIKSEMTEEQYTTAIARNRKSRAEALMAAQGELLNPQLEQFDEKRYLSIEGNEEATRKNLENYHKLVGYVAADTNNLSERVRKNYTDNLKAIGDELIKQKQKIDKILMEDRTFENLSRQYQQQLEGLDLFAHTEGEDFKEAQQYADRLMKTMVNAVSSGKAQSAEALRNALLADETFGQEWRRMNESWKTNAENNWLVIYDIIAKYSRDIAETSEKLFQENQTRIRKFIETTTEYKELISQANRIKLEEEGDKKTVEDEKAYTDFLSGKGALTQAQKRRQQIETLLRELNAKSMAGQQQMDNENRLYELQRSTTAAQYDARIQAAKSDSELQLELEREKNQALEDLLRDHNDKVRELNQEQAESSKAIQDGIRDAYIESWNTQFEKYKEYADAVGELTGTLASAEWNSVEDRQAAAKAFLQTISKLLIQELQERLKALIMKQTIDKAELASQQMVATQKSLLDKKEAVEEVSLEGKKAITVIGISGAKGAGKEIGSKGLAGLATMALVMAATTALSALVNSIISSAFPEASTTAADTTPKKRIAAGMLTYAEGRYPVRGNDGRNYRARYEPELETGIYNGGNGKAHMALFSEQMPEMVISGPTTKIIREDYPQLLDAILTIDRHKRRRQALPVYADGNLTRFAAAPDTTGTTADTASASAAREQALVALVTRMGASIDTLNSRLVNLHASINMYGPDGLKENLRRADEFYRKVGK